MSVFKGLGERGRRGEPGVVKRVEGVAMVPGEVKDVHEDELKGADDDDELDEQMN